MYGYSTMEVQVIEIIPSFFVISGKVELYPLCPGSFP